MSTPLPINFPEPPAPEAPVEEVAPKVTERDMLDALAVRYACGSQGASVRYAIADHVRSSAGFFANRTLDFMALDLWPSSGMPLHGHEVKTSRSDWLREVKDPAKAEEFVRYCDYFWLVIPDAKIIRSDEVPLKWGVLVGGHGRPIRVHRRAWKLTPDPLPRTFLAAFARAVQVTNHRTLAAAFERGWRR